MNIEHPPRLELRGLTRRFGAFVANDAIDLVVQPGQIHALLGENGAGKSTLVKMAYGVLRPDAGAILWDGQPVAELDPLRARAIGIGMVFQHFSLFDSLSVLENIALGLDAPGEMAALAARVRAVSAAYGLALDPDRPVHTLSVGERQRIEIVRCLLQRPKLLIMDEPTSVLTPGEVGALFATLRRLAAEGCAILYISHKLDEILALCDAATILRAGRVVGTCDPSNQSAASLARMMMGADVARAVRPTTRPSPGRARLVLDAIDLPARAPGEVALAGAALTVRAGEIVGVAGIAGNGQSELFAAISGERVLQNANDLLIDDAACGRFGADARRRRGLACVPEDRLGHGAVPAFSLADNLLLTCWRQPDLVRAGLLRPGAAGRAADTVIAGNDVRCAGAGAAAATLSGGNLQKFILGREMSQRPGVLVVCQPTWGVDAGAAAAIGRALLKLAAEGCAVLLISQDLDELLALADRICVLNAGRLSQPQPNGVQDIEAIGLLMGQGAAGLDPSLAHYAA